MKNSPVLVFILASLVSFGASAATDAEVPDASAPDDAVATGDSEADEEVAVEEAADEDEKDDEPYELPYDLGASISTGLAFSAGNLRPGLPETQQDDSLLNSWGFGVSKEFTDGFTGSLGWGFNKYLTRAGGLNLQREARINDLSVGLAYGPIYVIPRADISISASLGSVVPLSRMSRTSTLRTAISPGLAFSRMFGNLMLGANIGASKRFHQFTSAVVDANDVDALRRQGGAEDISSNEVAEAGVNTEWSMNTGLMAGYTWFENFSTSVFWAYARAWGYDVTPDECDELSSPYARCDGRIARDSMVGGMSVDYAFLDYYSVSLSATTAQLPKTADNRRVNFPFWDLQTPGLFNTTLGITLSAAL